MSTEKTWPRSRQAASSLPSTPRHVTEKSTLVSKLHSSSSGVCCGDRRVVRGCELGRRESPLSTPYLPTSRNGERQHLATSQPGTKALEKWPLSELCGEVWGSVGLRGGDIHKDITLSLQGCLGILRENWGWINSSAVMSISRSSREDRLPVDPLQSGPCVAALLHPAQLCVRASALISGPIFGKVTLPTLLP